MDKSGENIIEFLDDQKTASVTASQRRLINRLEKLAKESPEEAEILARNEDGTIFAHVPVAWIKINPPRKVTEEQRETARERMMALRDAGRLKT